MIGRTVTVRRYDTDRYGDRVLTLTFIVGHCAFGARATTRRSGTDNTDRANTVTSYAELYAPSWAGLQSNDVIEVDGNKWEVDGHPESWLGMTGTWRPGMRVVLKRVTG